MKQLLLLATILSCGFAAHSQVVFSEDFDGIPGPTAGGPGTYTFPSGWLLRNVDNRTPATNVSYVNEAWERREDFQTNVLDSAAFSTSWYTPAGAANDWMWTPAIAIPTNAVLKWNAKTLDPVYPDGYEVRIMTSPNTPTGGAAVIGNQITNSTVVYSTAAESSTWTARQVPLTAYTGQTVYIGFRNNATDKFLLVIDDVVVEVLVNNDLSVSNVSHGGYTAAPADQLTTAANFQLKGTITNNGQAAATNAKLGCIVSVDGAYLTTVESAATASLASLASEVKTITYSPTIDGDYSFKFYPILGAADQATGNDTIVDPIGITVDPFVMQRHTGAQTGTLGIGAGNGGYLGNSFTLVTPAYVDTIAAVLGQGFTGDNYAAAIWATDGAGEPTTIIAATDTMTYATDDAIEAHMAIYGGPVLLAAGTYVFTQIEFDSTLALGQTDAIFTLGKTFVDWPTNALPGWGNNEDFGASYSKPYMIWPIFNLCMNEVYVTDTVVTDASCGMSDGTATITPGAGYDIMWEDGSTDPMISGLDAGFHTYTVSNGTCSYSDSIEIVNPDAPQATVQTTMNAGCFGDEGQVTLNVTGGAAPYTITWSNGDTGTLIDVAGTYSATIVDDNNCSATVTNVTIAEPEELVANGTSTDETCTGCNDGTATVAPTGGTAPYSISWSNGGTGATITGLEPGTYTATVTDPNGCTTTYDATITDFVGIEELNNYGIVVYPNPVVDYLSIEAKKGDVSDITLIDASGRTISQLTKSANTFTLDMRQLAKGMYRVVIKTNTGATIVSAVAKQ